MINREYCWVHDGTGFGDWTCQHADCREMVPCTFERRQVTLLISHGNQTPTEMCTTDVFVGVGTGLAYRRKMPQENVIDAFFLMHVQSGRRFPRDVETEQAAQVWLQKVAYLFDDRWVNCDAQTCIARMQTCREAIEDCCDAAREAVEA